MHTGISAERLPDGSCWLAASMGAADHTEPELVVALSPQNFINALLQPVCDLRDKYSQYHINKNIEVPSGPHGHLPASRTYVPYGGRINK